MRVIHADILRDFSVKAPACSAELHSAVSQICNLQGSGRLIRVAPGGALPNAIRRYSRLKICATELCIPAGLGGTSRLRSIPATLRTTALLTGVLLLICGQMLAQGPTRYQARPGSKVSIAGTSTLHDWTMDGQIIGGYFELPANVSLDSSQAAPAGIAGGKLAARAEVNIPVRSMKSGHDGMDEVMQQAMNENAHPRIQFHLLEMTLKAPHTPGSPFEFDTKGELVVNGVTNAITMPVTVDASTKGRLKISGKTPLKMTAFNVKPPAPSLALGMIKTGDDITVSFDWTVAAAAAANTKTP